MTDTTPLDLDAIEGRHQSAIATGDAAMALGGMKALRPGLHQKLAEAAARSAADVPALVEEVERLRVIEANFTTYRELTKKRPNETEWAVFQQSFDEMRAERDSAVTERGVVLTEVKQLRADLEKAAQNKAFQGGLRADDARRIEALEDRIRELEAEVERFEHTHTDDCVSSDQMTRTIDAMQTLTTERDAALARAKSLELALDTEQQIGDQIATERDEALAKVADEWDAGAKATYSALETWYKPTSAEWVCWPNVTNPHRAALGEVSE